MMELVFAFLAGLLTLLNPCVLPILPIVVASSLRSGWQGPIYLSVGMGVSFVFLGVFVSGFGHVVGVDPQTVARISAVLMICFGVVLLLPGLMERFALGLSHLSTRADKAFDRVGDGRWGQLLGGGLLGAVWSPCIGPTLGGALALAASGESLLWASLIMVSFSVGVGILIVLTSWFVRRGVGIKKLSGIAKWSKPVLGVTFVLVGVALYFEMQQWLERWAIEHLPFWLQDISVMF